MSVAPWIKSYPRGVRWDAELTIMPVQQILERSAAKWPDNPVLDFMNKKILYRELDDLANRAAKGFRSSAYALACTSDSISPTHLITSSHSSA
jgi:long-chain acyl-CoA synthetase